MKVDLIIHLDGKFCACEQPKITLDSCEFPTVPMPGEKNRAIFKFKPIVKCSICSTEIRPLPLDMKVIMMETKKDVVVE